MGSHRTKYLILGLSALCLSAAGLACDRNNLITLRVEIGRRSVSKRPFVIAFDQGLYEKYGLDVQASMRSPEFEGGIEIRSRHIFARVVDRIRGRPRPFRPEVIVDGATPHMVDITTSATVRRQLFLASTDCVVRAHIVARRGIEGLEDLKGKRLGISTGTHTTTGFVALLLAERMGWDPVQDISIMTNGREIDDLREGRVDAIVASERGYAAALQEGFPVLADTRTWGGLPIAGNSVQVEPAWLEDSTNREAARRFLKATVEGVALFHQNRELALDVLAKWYGITDKEFAETVYEGGRSIPLKPYPCYEGIKKTMEVYDSNEMRRYKPEDFYDDSLMRELDESGFIDSLYATAGSGSQ